MAFYVQPFVTCNCMTGGTGSCACAWTDRRCNCVQVHCVCGLCSRSRSSFVSSLLRCQEHCLCLQAPAPATDATCTLTTELEEGPYWLDDLLFRSNITEDQPGVPLLLRIKLVNTDCEPVVDAFVDIWQCNSTGFYSGFTSESCWLYSFCSTYFYVYLKLSCLAKSLAQCANLEHS